MPIETDTAVERINTVTDEQGNPESPANESQQKNIETAVRDVDDAVSNHPGVGAFEHTTASTDVEQLASNAVPDGVEVLVQAAHGNNSPVMVGNSTAQPASVSPGNAVTLAVEDTSAIYVRALASGDAVGVLFEEDA